MGAIGARHACPKCGSDDTRIDGKVEPPLALLGEDEYVEHCYECGAEWVQAAGSDRVQVLLPAGVAAAERGVGTCPADGPGDVPAG